MSPSAAIVYDHVYPLHAGGGERVYTRLGELLVRRGWDVDYVTQHVSVESLRGFRVIGVWQGRFYDAEGLRLPRSAAGFAFGVWQYFRGHRSEYDLVIASALPPTTLIAASLGLGRRRTVLIGDWLEVWTLSEWRRYSGFVVGLIGYTLQQIARKAARRTTVNSRFTADRLGRGSSIVLGLVDLAEADTDHKVVAAAQPPYVLSVGRHIPDKRIETIPAALKVARESYPELRAIIVGEGPCTDAVRAEIARLELEDAVDLVGRVGDDELARLYAGASVLVHPSRREGFGLVVAEAAAHGVPSVVIAGDGNAAVELIDERTNGFLAPSPSANDFARSIVAALAGGDGLRSRTHRWFAEARVSRSLGASLDRILDQYALDPNP